MFSVNTIIILVQMNFGETEKVRDLMKELVLRDKIATWNAENYTDQHIKFENNRVYFRKGAVLELDTDRYLSRSCWQPNSVLGHSSSPYSHSLSWIWN